MQLCLSVLNPCVIIPLVVLRLADTNKPFSAGQNAWAF
jgi:hypothetical protein